MVTRTASPATSSGLCIVDLVLFFPDEGTGTAAVTAGGTTILTINMLNYYTTGSPGAGSGERIVTLSPAVAVGSGTTLALNLSACGGCERLTVTVEGASR
ncbi:MAG TPA: hypothetical protein VGO32_05045 [Candidatus Limnocylindria bacterium]|jgi:hypothetical protein|nr:hypothetical protein [Candidatus Limnocylindria bacterium]